MIGAIVGVVGLLFAGFGFGRVRSACCGERPAPAAYGRIKAGIVAGAGAAGAALRPIAVCAQQWAEVKFLMEADVSVAAHFGATLPRLYFRYRCQDDPDTVAAAFATMQR